MTLEDLKSLILAQDYRCAICSSDLVGKMHIDHNHLTGNVRGILCVSCNTALGSFRDNINILKRAINYLKRDTKRNKIMEAI